MHFIVALGFCISSNAQLRVPFTSRASNDTPAKKVYSINGDFTMIGNTNLTLQNYTPTTNNNNVYMEYIDVDNDPNTFNSSSADLTFPNENGATPDCSKIIYAGLYWTGKASPDEATYSPETFTVEKTIDGHLVSKTFNKREISLKGPNSNSYTKFTASPADIYYPNASDTFIYSAYAEVTDYVRSHGVGTYFAADLAVSEGNGGGTGFSGGWGLIVVYENYKMKYRDITIYDGHAYVLSSNINGFTLPIDGINTIQAGPVGVKLGLIASEGDVGISGDYFQIQKHSNGSFLNLNHSHNSTNNFFNSSINTNNSIRNPNLENNTGIDISMFSIPNSNNEVIGNNQTSTLFKYGTGGDTYVIFCMALSVDAYQPLMEGVLSMSSINHDPFVAEPYAILPGEEVEFNVDIKNIGIEAINNFKAKIPVPYNATYVPNSAHGNVLFSPNPSPNSIYFDTNVGANGAIIWDFGKLPLPINPEVLLANLTFKLKATTDCNILAHSNCSNAIQINGELSGVGAITGAVINNYPIIQGYEPEQTCGKKAIDKPITIAIDSADYVMANCQNTDSIRHVVVCNASTNSVISVDEVASYFPQGTMFYDAVPVTATSTSFSSSHPFLMSSGTSSVYYALTLGSNCITSFTLSRCSPIHANDDNINVALGTTGMILSSNILSNDNINNVAATESSVSITMISTSQPGVTLDGTHIVIAPGIPAGNYTITYQICDLNNPTNCDQAIVFVTIYSSNIIANDDSITSQSCLSNTISRNLLANDTLNGNPVTTAAVNFTVLSGENSNITIDAMGLMTIASSIPIGNYHLTYKICNKLPPFNCASAAVNITIKDETPPILPTLTAVSQQCSVTVQSPTTTDECSGLIIGTTDDSLTYNAPGNYVIHWNFTDASNNSVNAIQNVTVTTANTLEPLYSYIDCNEDNAIEKNLDLNTLLPASIPKNGVWTDESQVGALEGTTFKPYKIPVGYYPFKYEVAQGNCLQAVEAMIEVDNDCLVAGVCNFLVHNAFSPNNDGINEVFYIENIEQTTCFPTNAVEIYNRWGALVYETQQYDNVARVFRGISQGRLTIATSEHLPTGTYFYSIHYTDAQDKLFQQEGYLYLSR